VKYLPGTYTNKLRSTDDRQPGANPLKLQESVGGPQKDRASGWFFLDGTKCFKFDSVLWHYWLANRNDTQPVKTCTNFRERFSFGTDEEEYQGAIS